MSSWKIAVESEINNSDFRRLGPALSRPINKWIVTIINGSAIINIIFLNTTTVTLTGRSISANYDMGQGTKFNGSFWSLIIIIDCFLCLKPQKNDYLS